MRNIPAPVAEHQARLRELLVQMGRLKSLRDPIFAACEQLQLTAAQFHALLWLGHDGALRMGELARRVGVTEKTMTGVVDRLERSGHLQRQRDGTDRRVVEVHLTRQGQAAYRKVDAKIDQQLGMLLTVMDPGDRPAFVGILERMVLRMSQAPAAPKRARP